MGIRLLLSERSSRSWRATSATGKSTRPSVGRLLSGLEQRLDGPPLVHGAVALRHLIQGQGQVEDLAGVDPPVPDQVDQLGQETAHRSRAAMEVEIVPEERINKKLHIMWRTQG